MPAVKIKGIRKKRKQSSTKAVNIKVKRNSKQERAEAEFQEMIRTGEVQELVDGLGNFQGYDDEAGHRYATKQEVIDAFGLGEE